MMKGKEQQAERHFKAGWSRLINQDVAEIEMEFENLTDVLQQQYGGKKKKFHKEMNRHFKDQKRQGAAQVSQYFDPYEEEEDIDLLRRSRQLWP
jgi:uncharacterized protein (DUF2225 family)